jgi:hypothetical protein
MSESHELPFLLAFEEVPNAESSVDGYDDEFFLDQTVGGMVSRSPFVAWDGWLHNRS